jgi:hypothetical protein
MRGRSEARLTCVRTPPTIVAAIRLGKGPKVVVIGAGSGIDEVCEGAG